MSLPVVLSLCMGGIVCLTPLTLYLFWLAALNRRVRPTVVAGNWDFVALLAALSGFLLCVGFVLSAVSVQASPFAGGGFAQVWRTRWLTEVTWLLVTGGYLALVLAAAALTLRRRQRTLAVYNIDPADAEAALAAALANAGLAAGRFGNLWSDGRPLAEVVPFHALKHVSVRLLADDQRLREELERELRAAVPRRPAADNPAAAWIATAAVAALIAVLGCSLLIFIAVFARG